MLVCTCFKMYYVDLKPNDDTVIPSACGGHWLTPPGPPFGSGKQKDLRGKRL